MLTIRNIRQITLLAKVPSRPIAFRSGSPLSKLVGKLPPETDTPEDALVVVSGDEQHESIMSVLVQEMIPLITANVSFVRNTISAQIEEIVNTVEANAAAIAPMYLPVKVVTTRVPTLLNSEFLTTFTREYRDSRVETVVAPRSGTFPAYTADELITRMAFLHTDAELISDVADLADSVNISIVSIYNKWFRGQLVQDYPTPTSTPAPSYIPFMYIEWAVVFLLAQGFYKHTDGNVSMRLEEYNLFLLRLIANTGKYLHNSVPQLKRTYDASGKTYMGVSRTDNITSIIMNGNAYSVALTNGSLTDQIVIGADMLGMLPAINDADVISEEFKAKAMLQYNGKLAAYQAITLDRYKANVMVEMMRCILQDIDEGQYACADMSKQEIITKCRSLIDEYAVLGADKLFLMVRSVVTKGLYPYSGAFAYYTAMDNYQSVDAAIDPRVAATLATRDVIIEYCVNQIAGVK